MTRTLQGRRYRFVIEAAAAAPEPQERGRGMTVTQFARQLRKESGVSARLAAPSLDGWFPWLESHKDEKLSWLGHSVKWALRTGRLQTGLEMWLRSASAKDLCDWFAYVYEHSENNQASMGRTKVEWWKAR
jgi:hypothetical protein